MMETSLIFVVINAVAVLFNCGAVTFVLFFKQHRQIKINEVDSSSIDIIDKKLDNLYSDALKMKSEESLEFKQRLHRLEKDHDELKRIVLSATRCENIKDCIVLEQFIKLNNNQHKNSNHND